MAVKVRFPDGSEREVPSRTVATPSTEIGRASYSCSEEPLFDPDWQFTPGIGGWTAVPRDKN
jgi:hypothetical protein